MRRRDILGMMGAWMGASLLPVAAQDMAKDELAEFHQGILQRYPDVQHMTPQILAALDEQEVILFDVRQKSEYGVSHLKNAIRVSPSMTLADFMKKYGKQSEGKNVIFYCSIGERSSKLAQQVEKSSMKETVLSVYNLEGGLFQWHNESRPVFNSDGQTDQIHPFNEYWGRLLLRQDKLRMN